MRIALFTGALDGADPRLGEAVDTLASELASRNIGIVYGGGYAGLMGRAADAALARGGEVIGVIPRALLDVEMGHTGLTRLDVVETMHERKAAMTALADAFIAMPGGSGTLDEIFEAWTWQQLAYHRCPVAFYNPHGYWDPLIEALHSMAAAGFIRQRDIDSLIVESDPEALLRAIEAWRPVKDHCEEWADIAKERRD
ncbi:TIGR00730 family Rossman fold protein [Nanchangia anserum]|uniref:Cytokinin riboside 5'-monophosphate phosphoribohydrolase n=1 Tax=Nanchangia anserum TaxID=2692125 RepID=A0A8I0GCH9_9ACTO|nr:TIGR00730 family Rossman fold protein [Nanchangia anserum]MBD3689486.1 TIGR00730 family Rossman fold protein [Nanchangia anserum]QOX81677.1 TIGR00730 family Rossman fold protein [Nanchangia anserum]